MLDTTQTVVNRAIQPVSQSWLRRIFGREISAKERRVYMSQLNELFSNIAQAHFEQFADALVIASNEDIKIRDKQTILNNTLEALNKGVLDYLGKSSAQGVDVAQAVINYYIMENIQRYPLFSTFSRVIDELKAAFPQDKDAMLKVVEEHDVRLMPHIPIEVSNLIKSIASVLQRIAITVLTQYPSSKSVNVDAKASLVVTLKAVNIIRLKYALVGTTDIPLHGLDYALRDFNRELALAEQRVWLPFKPLVMAPLASQEDLKLYARASEDVETFANRIGTGDGVFLVTGYRGVGKSTFIYEALSILADPKQNYQGDDDHWHIVPISISLAKASGITNILRLCIRRLFDTFLKKTDERSDVMSSLTKGVDKLLTRKEREHLGLAYLRATWKVNIQREDNVKVLKQLGLNADMSIKLSSFFAPTVGNPVAGTFPSFGISGKMDKEWSKAMGSTVALPDYDEDKAEDDIVQLIRMLAKPAKERGNSRIKLVFIFDEMDKMSEEEQEELIKQLKNLFLERHSVFLLVTSKGFYYRWWDKRSVEDDVLTSYFSGIQTVPLFTSKETADLLKRLIQTDDAANQLSDAGEFIDTLARYLTYRARGIPRDIMRELQLVQLRSKDSPQAYMENCMGQYPTIYVHADLQNSLERLFDDTNTISSTQTSSASTSVTVDNTLGNEPMWTNEGRKEHVKRGLSVIMEEMLDQGSIVLNPDSELFKRIYEDNFKTVSSHDFKLLLEQLAELLKKIRINIGPNTPLASYYPKDTSNTELELFSLETVSETPGETIVAVFQKIVVSLHFYSITGRPRNDTSVEEDTPLSQKEIEALLKRTDNRQWNQQHAIDALQHAHRPFSEGIYDQLCLLFLTAQNTQTRRSVIGLQDGAFFDTVHRVGDKALNTFIETETDEKLLQEFIRLVRKCTEMDKGNNFTDGMNMLLLGLDRHKKAIHGGPQGTRIVGSPLALPEPLLIATIFTLATIACEDVLLQVMQSLNPNKDIPNALLGPLRTLESKSKQGLIELLVELNFNAISLDTLQTLLGGEGDNRLVYLWEWVLAQKKKAVAQKVLIVLAQQIVRNPTMYINLTNKVVAWVDGPTWDDTNQNNTDQYILSEALASSPGLRFQLQPFVTANNQKRIPAEVVLPLPNPVSAEPKSSSNDGLYAVLGIVVVLAIIVAIPVAAIIFHISWLLWLCIGVVAGLLASLVMRGGGYGIVGDIVVGCVGAFIGGSLTNLWVTNLWVTGSVAFVGACILIAILRTISRGPRRV